MKAKQRSSSPRRKTGPAKPRPVQRMVSCISNERIRQLLNAKSEGVAIGTAADWRAVAEYLQNEIDYAHNSINAIRPSVAAWVAGTEMQVLAHSEMKVWLKRVRS